MSETGKTIALIEALKGNGGGGGGLPAVTESDKNKYLHTNESTGDIEWADAESEIYYVTFGSSGPDFYCKKTFSEIDAAINAGKTVIGRENGSLGRFLAMPYKKSVYGDGSWFEFSTVGVVIPYSGGNNPVLSGYIWKIDENNSVTRVTVNYPLTPAS